MDKNQKYDLAATSLMIIGVILLFSQFILFFLGLLDWMIILSPIVSFLFLGLATMVFLSKEWSWIGLELFLDKTKRLEARIWNSSFVYFSVAKTKDIAIFGATKNFDDEIETGKTFLRTSSGNQFAILRQGFEEALDLIKMYVPTIDAEVQGMKKQKFYNMGLKYGSNQVKEIKGVLTMVGLGLVIVGVLLIINLALTWNLGSVIESQAEQIVNAFNALQSTIVSSGTEIIVEPI